MSTLEMTMKLAEKPTAIRLGVGQLNACETLAVHYEEVLGKTVNKDLQINHQLTWDDFD